MTDPSPIDVVLAACRAVVGTDSDALLAGHEGDAVDWDAVIALAEAHGVLPLLYAALREAHPEESPARARLGELVQPYATRSLLRTHRLKEVLHLLAAHGIEVMPLKGPVLAHVLYGHSWYRSSHDLDLLLERSDIEPAAALLATLGYRDRAANRHPAIRAAELRRDCEREFDADQPSRPPIELHWRLFPASAGPGLETAEIKQRAGVVAFAGMCVPLMRAEDLVLYLCLHGAKHAWAALSLLCDLARTIVQNPALDWELVMSQATRIHARRRTALGLLLARELLHMRLPAAVDRWIHRDTRTLALAALLRDHLLAGRTGWPSAEGKSFHYAKFQATMLDSGIDLLRYRAWRAYIYLTPQEDDIAAISLPPRLYPLYFLVRIARLPFEVPEKFSASSVEAR